MSLKQTVIKGFFWVSLASMAINIVQFCSRIILARILSPNDFGVVALAISIIGFINTFQDFGLGTALVQRKKYVDESFNTAFLFILLSSFSFTIISLVLLGQISVFFNDLRLKEALFITALTIPSAIITIPYSAYISKNLLFFNRFLAETLPVIIGQATSLILAVMGFGYKSLVFGYIIGVASLVIILLLLTPWRPKFIFDKTIFKELFNYGKYIFLSNILAITLAQGSNLILGRILTTEDVGFYAMAYTLATLPAVNSIHAISKVVFPTFAKLQDNTLGLISSFTKTIKLMSAIILPMTGGLIIISPFLFSIILGEKWLPAFIPFIIFCILALFKSLMIVPSYYLQGTGDAHIDFKILVSGIGIFFILIIPLVLNYKVIGASIAITIAYGVMLVYYAQICKKIINIQYTQIVLLFFPSVIATFLMSVTGFFLIQFFSKKSVIGMTVTILICAAIYLITLYKKDKELVNETKEVLCHFFNTNN